MKTYNSLRLTKYCDDCEEIVELTEDGYCKSCGKHADNMDRTINYCCICVMPHSMCQCQPDVDY